MTIINKFLSFISIVLKQTVSSPFIQRQKSLLCQRIHSDQTELYYCHAHQLHCHQIRSKSERRKRNSRCACTYTYTYNAHKYTTHIHPLSALTHAFSFLPILAKHSPFHPSTFPSIPAWTLSAPLSPSSSLYPVYTPISLTGRAFELIFPPCITVYSEAIFTFSAPVIIEQFGWSRRWHGEPQATLRLIFLFLFFLGLLHLIIVVTV